MKSVHSFILFRCSSTGNEHNGTIHETAGCIEVDPNPSYTIIATDAVEDINVVAPVTITGVSVPDFTTSVTQTHTVSPSNTSEYLITMY